MHLLDVLSPFWVCTDNKKLMRQARISWFGTNHVKRIYSVTKGFLCTAWLQKDSQAVNIHPFKNNFVRQKDRNNVVIIRMRPSPSEAVQLQIVDKTQRRNSCIELTVQYC